MARRTKEDAEKTRGRIIDAAEKIFYAHGVTRSSLEQIAEEAGVTRGAVYWHFKDKAELFHAMAQRIFLPHEDLLEKMAARPSATPLLDLKNACIHALKMMSKDKRRREVVTILFLRCEYVEEMLDIIKRRNVSKNKMLVLSEKLFLHARELKMLAPCWTPRQAAVAMEALIVGLILGWLEQPKKIGLVTIGASCVEAFFNSLQAHGPSKD
ncbi:MAG: TetR family transcriptional regulator [Bdellovibrionales bacterium]|jgi:AcrR family transcriptional regulator